MNKNIFYPQTNLFPSQPQILHQMILQFFLLADNYEKAFPKEEMAHGILLPYGSYFDTGLRQAAGYRFMLGFHKPENIVLIAFADLPGNTTCLGCNYEALHTFFGELSVDHTLYKHIEATTDNDLFTQHADPIICQLPFLRSYQKIESVTPIIINNKKTDLDRNRFWSALHDEEGKTCYVICTNEVNDMVRYATL